MPVRGFRPELAEGDAPSATNRHGKQRFEASLMDAQRRDPDRSAGALEWPRCWRCSS